MNPLIARTCFLLLLSCLLLSGCQWSPTPENMGKAIRGRVVDAASGAGLAAVHIAFAADESQENTLIGQTNPQGFYADSLGEFETPPAGRVTFSKEGYDSRAFQHVPTRSTWSMRFGCWETVPEVVEMVRAAAR